MVVYNGKPYEQMDDLEGKTTPIFGSTPIYTHSNAQQLHGSTESSQSVYFKSFLLFQYIYIYAISDPT